MRCALWGCSSAHECAGEGLVVVAGVVRQDVRQGVLHDGR